MRVDVKQRWRLVYKQGNTIEVRASLQEQPVMMIDMSEARETTQDNNLRKQ